MLQIVGLFLLLSGSQGIPLDQSGPLSTLGTGYNILFGNPEGDPRTGHIDPGVKTTRHIFDFTYEEQKVSVDGQLVPDQVAFSQRQSCVTSSSTTIFQGTRSYQDELKHYVSQLGYSAISQSTDVGHHVFFDDVTVCNLGRARYVDELALADRFPLSRDFVADACALPATFDPVEYMRFLDTWGTHIVAQVDIGSRTVRRSQADYTTLVQFARKLDDTSYSSDGKYATIDVDSLKERLSEEPALFDDLVETMTLGSSSHAEPIAVGLMGIDEVLSIDYWQLMDRYVSEGLCSEGDEALLASKKGHLKEAMSAYPSWHNAEMSSDPVVQSAITWPIGTYSLPMTDSLSGCPNSAFFWTTGRRFQDTQDLWANNQWSDPCHLPGPYARNNVQQNFCSKMDNLVTESDLDWDEGEYCIFKKGICPSGFAEGWIKWDDQDALNSNEASGVLPDGVYDHNTLIYFCCREDGDPTVPILLPTADPFYLFRKNGKCQAVEGMTLIEEWFRWDGEDDFVDFTKYSDGSVPFMDSRDDDHKLYYCYYY
ncbi:uncharacterized protein LOC117298694 [Asterias rubens]|uniref:uncharacterized protein LOC117298694 n=1 Tax=Asterias rubens TaxID=7604 RepID=UPI0014555F97|nr:uncharacterized protein LOC117298694 [Asterias rubens]